MNSKRPHHRKVTALLELAPGCSYNAEADGTIIKWLTPDVPQPSEADIQAKMDEYKIEWDAQEYARNRASAYPSTGDQLDMQYHDQLDGTTTWKDAVAKVKSDNPKPE